MELDYLHKIAVFARVAHHLSFSAAAAELGLSTGTVSRQVASLEQEIHVQLLVRSTRKVALSEPGQIFFERSKHLLSLAEESLAEIQDLHSAPRGTLKITAPRLFGVKHLSPMIAAYTDQHPMVDLRMHFGDSLESVLSGDFDVAVRITNHLDDGVIAMKLSPIRWVVCANYKYINKHGEPKTPKELQHHQCCHYPSIFKQDQWSFIKDNIVYDAPIRPKLQVNSSELIENYVLSGHGIAILPTYLAGEHLRTGALTPVLAAFRPNIDSSLYAIYPPTKYLPTKIRCFIDALKTSFTKTPYWETDLDEVPIAAPT